MREEGGSLTKDTLTIKFNTDDLGKKHRGEKKMRSLGINEKERGVKTCWKRPEGKGERESKSKHCQISQTLQWVGFSKGAQKTGGVWVEKRKKG